CCHGFRRRLLTLRFHEMIPPLRKCQSLPGRLMRRERCAMPRHSDTVSDEITGLAPVGAGLPVFLIEDLNPASGCLSNRLALSALLIIPGARFFLSGRISGCFARRRGISMSAAILAIVSPQVRR